MMYIVLTAMLALNVAAEVLEAFRVVDSSLLHTLEAVDTKTKQVYSSFEQAYIENPAKVQEWKDKADLIRERTNHIYKYIGSLKEELVKYSGSTVPTVDDPVRPDQFYYVTLNGDTLIIEKQDDLNSPSELLITQGKATDLKDQIIQYRNALVSVIEPDDKELIASTLKELETPDPEVNRKEGAEKKTWEDQFFLDKPLVAIMTLLSKMQIDVKNAEANLINYLYAQIDAGSFKFNRLGARVIANSNIVLQGDEYVAEVFLAAEDTTQSPEILIEGQSVEVVDGKATYKGGTNQPGTFTWSGLIKYKTPSGVIKNYPFEQTYQVTQPGVTMSATKMNVFYLGVDNPFDVLAGGIAKEDLSVSMSNGEVDRTGNDFIIRPEALDEQGLRTKVSVYANIAGQRKLIGSSSWRVKQVPDPVAQVAAQSGGEIRKEVLAAQDGVLAVLEDFDFDFEYKITQFEVQTTGVAGYANINRSNSNRFTEEQKRQLQRVRPQGLVYIGNIKAIGDDGKTRDLDPITFKVR